MKVAKILVIALALTCILAGGVFAQSTDSLSQTTQNMKENAMGFYTIKILGVELYYYLVSALFVLLGLFASMLVGKFTARLRKVFSKTDTQLDDIVLDALEKPARWFCIIGGIYVALNIFSFDVKNKPAEMANKALVTLTILLFIWIAFRLLEKISGHWFEKSKASGKTNVDIIPMFRVIGRLCVIGLGLVLILSNLGYSVEALITGLGIGGLAVALASKDTLDNLFGSLVLFFDKPFHLGEVIQMDNIEGTVEEIGLRSTRVRTYTNTIVTIPNSAFTTSKINNITSMEKRRIKLTIGLSYETSPETIEKVMKRLKDIIKADDEIRQDFCVVNLDAFSIYSLDISVHCFTVTIDWQEYMRVKEKVMLKFMRAFIDMGVKFAIPTQKTLIERNTGDFLTT